MIAAGRRSKCSCTSAGQLHRVDLGRAEGLDHDRHRASDADRVRDLHLAALGDPGGDDVLRRVAHRVRRGAVDLRRVLARERAATVAGHAAVGVDDDLAAGQAAVGVRAAELEAAGRVDEHLEVVVGELRGEQRLDHVLDEVGLQQRVDVDAGRVLGRDEHGRQPLGHAVLVLDRHLGLAVGTQVRSTPPCGPRPAGARAGARARSASA